MKVIDLNTRTIYVDDIQQIYMETNYNPTRYNVKTTYGTCLVDKEDYFKVKDYLLSLNDEVEIIEDKKIEKIDVDWQNVFDEQAQQDFAKMTLNKINEIIDKINEVE